MTEPYVRKGKLPASVLTHTDLHNLFEVVHGPDESPATIEIAVEYKNTVSQEIKKATFTSPEDFLGFMNEDINLMNFIVGFNFCEGTHQILISYINTPLPSGSLYIFGKQTWVDEQFVQLANLFHLHKNTFTTMLFNGFTGKIVNTVIPFLVVGFLITVTLAAALPTMVRIEYFGVLTVACIFGTFKFGLVFSDWLIKHIAERYPYFLYQK